MKTILPVVVFTLLYTAACAQTEKGKFVLSGKTDLNFLFSKVTTSADSVQTGNTKSEQYEITAGVGYFLIDNLSIALSGSYSYNYTDVGASNYMPSHSKSITQSFTLLPQFQYYFPVEGKLRPFVAIGAGYVWLQQKDSRVSNNSKLVYNFTGMAYSGGAGASYFITNSVAFDLGLQYSYNRLKDGLIPDQIWKEKQFAGSIGISVFL